MLRALILCSCVLAACDAELPRRPGLPGLGGTPRSPDAAPAPDAPADAPARAGCGENLGGPGTLGRLPVDGGCRPCDLEGQDRAACERAYPVPDGGRAATLCAVDLDELGSCVRETCSASGCMPGNGACRSVLGGRPGVCDLRCSGGFAGCRRCRSDADCRAEYGPTAACEDLRCGSCCGAPGLPVCNRCL